MRSRVPRSLLSRTSINARISRNYFSSRVILLPRYLRTIASFQTSDRIARGVVAEPRGDDSCSTNISSSRDTNTPNVATMGRKTFQEVAATTVTNHFIIARSSRSNFVQRIKSRFSFAEGCSNKRAATVNPIFGFQMKGKEVNIFELCSMLDRVLKCLDYV